MPSFKATSLVFLVAALAVLAPVKSAPTFQARHEGHDDDAVSASASAIATATSTASPVATSVPAFIKQNALDAQKLNAQFKKMNETDSCQDGQMACISSKFAQCVSGKWALSACAEGLSCYALPLVNKAGTSLVCDTQEDTLKRFEAAGVQGGSAGDSTTTTTTTGTATDDGDDGDDDCDDDADDDAQDGADDDSSSSASASPNPISVKSATPTAASSTTGAPTVVNQDKAPSVTTVTVTLSASNLPSVTEGTVFTTITLNRRQLLTTLASSATAVSSSTLASIPVITSSPSISVSSVATATTSASSGVITPTVVIGTDGIVTVTLVSTVTVSATDCAASATIAPVPVTVATAIPTVSTIISSIGTQVPPASASVSVSSPISVSSSTSTPFITLVQAPVSSTAVPTTSVSAINNGGGFFTFSFSTPATTAAPAEQTGTFDISELLTATI